MTPYILLVMFWYGTILAFTDGKTAGRRIRALAGKGMCAARSSGPVKALKALSLRRRSEKLKDELSECLSYTRNIAILGSSRRLSAGELLAALAAQSVLLRPVFLDMAHALNTNDRQRAAGALYSVLREPYAKDIGGFLASWEDTDPDYMLRTLEVYRGMLREERVTRIRKRDELLSDIIYFPVVIDCMVVLLNFLYVAYFLQQKELLQLFF